MPSSKRPTLIRRQGKRLDNPSRCLVPLCRHGVITTVKLLQAIMIIIIGIQISAHYFSHTSSVLATTVSTLNNYRLAEDEEKSSTQKQQPRQQNAIDDDDEKNNEYEDRQLKNDDGSIDRLLQKSPDFKKHGLHAEKQIHISPASITDMVSYLLIQAYTNHRESFKGFDEAITLADGAELQRSIESHAELREQMASFFPLLGQDGLADSDASSSMQSTIYDGYMETPPCAENGHLNEIFKCFVPKGGHRYEEYKSGSTPTEITPEMIEQSNIIARERREYVKDAMIHVWSSYKKYAFGADELLPLSKKPSEPWGGVGATLVDALDTLWIMGLRNEFWEARDWVRDKLSYSNVSSVSVFETTIRSLGGLLSAYDLSGDPVFLEKADDLGSRLIRAFETPNGIPYGKTALNETKNYNPDWLNNRAVVAEAGTLQIEFRYLSNATNKSIYAEKVNKILDILADHQPPSGLYPMFVRNDVPYISFDQFSKVSLGAMGDSLYEYMLKTWLQGGEVEDKYRKMFDRAMDGIHNKLVQKSAFSGLTYVADSSNEDVNHKVDQLECFVKNSLGNDNNPGRLDALKARQNLVCRAMDGVRPEDFLSYFSELFTQRLDRKMDHLACFMGGLWALGAYTNPDGLDSPRAQRDLANGKALTYTCYQMYARFPTGLSPEFVRFDDNPEGTDFSVGHAPSYLLRPEVVESLFVLNFLTGDPVYREWGWEIFQAIERFCRTEVAYGEIGDVRNVNQPPKDKMESFFLSETLKYLYLLFDPETEIDILNTHVFNTEAHPLRRFDRLKKSESFG